MALTHNSKVADSEQDWSKIDTSRLPSQAFAYAPAGSTKSEWKYPHHWVQNGGELDENGIYTTGDMYLHKAGLNAAWSAANGGRSGEKADAKILAHLDKHRTDLGLGEHAEAKAMELANKGKQNFTMELDRSGYAADGRGWSALYIQHLYENTVLCMEKYGMLIPIHSGHESDNNPIPEESDGFVTAIRLKDNPDMQGEKIIEGDIELQGNLLKSYNSGKLPKRSVEIYGNYVTPDGKEMGAVIGGLALMGAHQPALPDLKHNENGKSGILKSINDGLQKILGMLGMKAKEIKEAKTMADKAKKDSLEPNGNTYPAVSKDAFDDAMSMAQEGLQELQDAVTKIGTALKGFMDDEAAEDTAGQPEEGADTGGAPTDMPSPGKQSKQESATVKSLQARTAFLEKKLADQEAASIKKERDDVFNKLHFQGKVSTDEREIFDAIADKKGLALAAANYEKRIVNTPTRGGALNMGYQEPANTSIDALRETYKANKATPEMIEQRVAKFKANPMNLQTFDETEGGVN